MAYPRPNWVSLIKSYGWILLALGFMVWGAHKSSQGGIWGFLFG